MLISVDKACLRQYPAGPGVCQCQTEKANSAAGESYFSRSSYSSQLWSNTLRSPPCTTKRMWALWCVSGVVLYAMMSTHTLACHRLCVLRRGRSQCHPWSHLRGS